ncbi:hypothetical protein RJ640_014720 [Escallonia rubra]|uniref:PRISE-like Rossmann-fold domain-containing protein n=1 Tax=Escallonia rubra TaxID=112253 RepID=A0AA88UR50_9ASTE|nr:hypothetical protein RJ640_014720 [Escallonia rubra]
MEQEIPRRAVALIVGVTGMVGVSLAEALQKPTAIGGPWMIYGASRRPLPSWFPSSLLDEYITFDALNLDETIANLSSISTRITHVFWVAFQVRESEELNVTLNSTMLTNVLIALKSSNICHITIQTGTKHYMGPIFDTTLSNQLIPHAPPFREDYPRLPFPNFYYALEDLIASHARTFTYSIHRSSIIIGASSRSVYNLMLTLSVYATICKHEGLPFRYFGNRYTWEHFCDMSDARVLAEQHIWAAVTDKAKNQAFNCTNGDVFMWKSFWKALCNVFDLEFVEYDEEYEFDCSEYTKAKGKVWDDLVERHDLYKTKMDEIACFDALKTVLHFDFQHVCSMNKSRDFGFFGYADTLESIRMWVGRLRQMKIIP